MDQEFDHADTNDDGELDYKEFVRLLTPAILGCPTVMPDSVASEAPRALPVPSAGGDAQGATDAGAKATKGGAEGEAPGSRRRARRWSACASLTNLQRRRS